MSKRKSNYWNLANIGGLKRILQGRQTRKDEPVVVIVKTKQSKDLEGFMVLPDNEMELIDWANRYIPTGGWQDTLEHLDISPVSAHPKSLLAEVFPDKVNTLPKDIKFPEPLTKEEEAEADELQYLSESHKEFEKSWGNDTFFVEEKYSYLDDSSDPLDISYLDAK